MLLCGRTTSGLDHGQVNECCMATHSQEEWQTSYLVKDDYYFLNNVINFIFLYSAVFVIVLMFKEL